MKKLIIAPSDDVTDKIRVKSSIIGPRIRIFVALLPTKGFWSTYKFNNQCRHEIKSIESGDTEWVIGMDKVDQEPTYEKYQGRHYGCCLGYIGNTSNLDSNH